MSVKTLLKRFDAWKSEGRTLVLATVVATTGSTYTKAGHRILISDTGECEGLVSGGCLEGDLALHAARVIASGESLVIDYDLRREGDELFGLGIGCDGSLRILLQRLAPADGYEPLATISTILRGDTASDCTIVLADHGNLRTGTTRVGPSSDIDAADLAGTAVLGTRLQPLPRLLVLGAGPDAVPVVTLADTLGWRVTLADHRPAYLDRPGFSGAETRVSAPAGELADRVSLPTFAAAIVMSHHLATDRRYLVTLASSPIAYVGLLGPRGRRERLLREVGAAAARNLARRLHGPAGLDIGANSPESIALAILAQIHGQNRDTAGSL